MAQPAHNASRSALGSSLAAKDDVMFKAQKFMQLFMSDIVSSKLKSKPSQLRHHKKWRISLTTAFGDSPQETSQKVFVNNGGEQIYEFAMTYPTIETDLFNVERIFNLGRVGPEEGAQNSGHQKKMHEKILERNQLGFLRFAMT